MREYNQIEFRQRADFLASTLAGNIARILSTELNPVEIKAKRVSHREKQAHYSFRLTKGIVPKEIQGDLPKREIATAGFTNGSEIDYFNLNIPEVQSLAEGYEKIFPHRYGSKLIVIKPSDSSHK